ncbi:MAG: Zn-ribbon domain-containing OB-fold protein [Dethiobacteria bacterium]|jgi:uncharacterized OB-fold protein
MGFEKFGQVSFTSQAKVGAFVDYLEKGELRGTKCSKCGETFFPPRADCSKCLSKDMEWIKIEGTGSLVSFTKVHYGPTGFETDVPYILALADFDGTRVFGRFNKEIPEEQLKVGMQVKAETITIDGQVSYEFLLA